MVRTLCVGLVVAPAVSPAKPAVLGPDAPRIAVQRYETARKLYSERQYADAAREFLVAFEIMPQSAKLAYNAARCLERSQQPRRAVELYKRYLVLAPDASDHAAVQKVVAALERLHPPEPEPELEPEPSVVAEAEAEADPEPKPSEWRTPTGWGLAGAGVVGLAVGAVFLGQAAGTADEAESLTRRERANQDVQGELDGEQMIGWTGVGVGVTFVAAGVALLLWPESEPAVALGPGGSVVMARF